MSDTSDSAATEPSSQERSSPETSENGSSSQERSSPETSENKPSSQERSSPETSENKSSSHEASSPETKENESFSNMGGIAASFSTAESKKPSRVRTKPKRLEYNPDVRKFTFIFKCILSSYILIFIFPVP